MFMQLSSASFQDLVSLVVQGVGGGVASSAVGDNENPDTVNNQLIFSMSLSLIQVLQYRQGGNIMLGGIIFQMGKYSMPCALTLLNKIGNSVDIALRHSRLRILCSLS